MYLKGSDSATGTRTRTSEEVQIVQTLMSVQIASAYPLIKYLGITLSFPFLSKCFLVLREAGTWEYDFHIFILNLFFSASQIQIFQLSNLILPVLISKQKLFCHDKPGLLKCSDLL